MIIVKDTFYCKEEIEKLREVFDVYIKTVIDVNKKICCAGPDRHFECEQILLEKGSKQNNLWGGGIDIETKEIDCNSMINMRPKDDNRSNEIQNPQIRENFENLTRAFFKEFYDTKPIRD